MVLINLDSDCSNVNEDNLSSEEKALVREYYRGNITAVVKFWLSTGAVVALGGPVLLGEGPIRPFNVARFRNKDVMLNAYVDMNKEVAAAYNIPFMDFRAKLLSALPWYRLYYNGYVTRGRISLCAYSSCSFDFVIFITKILLHTVIVRCVREYVVLSLVLFTLIIIIITIIDN
jgi:hypothetical protein